MNPIIDELEKPYMEKEVPDVNPGDTVRVFVRIVEGNKERIQAFEGTIIKEHGSGINRTITVRKVFQGVGVERVFLLHSPRIEKINIVRRGDVKRSKLYYLRERSGKATRIKEKIEKLGLELGMSFSDRLMSALEAESVRVRSEVEETK